MTNKNLILTGWGRSDYAVAAAVALRAIGEAERGGEEAAERRFERGDAAYSPRVPRATIIFVFFFCVSAHRGRKRGEKGVRGEGGEEGGWSLECFNAKLRKRCALAALSGILFVHSGYWFLRGRPGLLLGNAISAAFLGSISGLKSGYFAM